MGVQVEGERLVSTLLINNAVEVVIIDYHDGDDDYDDNFEDFNDEDEYLGGCWPVLLFIGGFQPPTFS